MPEPKLSFEELKKLGAPFDAVEVHVSRHAGTAKLVLWLPSWARRARCRAWNCVPWGGEFGRSIGEESS